MASKTAVAKKENTAVAVHTGYGAYSGKGLENVSAKDLVIPFIKISQDLSAQVKSGIATEGQIFNPTSKRAVDEYRFVPCYVTMDYVEWLPQAGGFVARHKAGDPIVAEAAKNEGKLPNKNVIQQTFYIYGVEVNEDGSPGMFICIPFASTTIKAYKNLMTSVTTLLVDDGTGKRVNPPLFAHCVKMVGRDDVKFQSKNCDLLPASGQTFEDSLIPVDSDLFKKALECHSMAESSDLSAHTSYESDGGAPADAGDEGDDEDCF
jgi:hypothetical protein